MLNHCSRTAIILGVVAFATATYAAVPSASEFLHSVNQNHDKTISLHELDAYATKRFDTISHNADTTLSRRELAGRLSDSGFKIANSNKPDDHTVSKAEFISYADRLFKEANTNPDGTLSVRELSMPAGTKLIQLLR